jgi:uroporphyrinogen-III synthase
MTVERDNVLAGKRIVLTRAAEQPDELRGELIRRGVLVLVLPCVEFRPPEDCAALDVALSRLPEFDWVAFTSQNAVRFFCRRLRESGRVLPDLTLPRTAALGKATANAAAKEGLHVDFVAREARSGSEFVGEFAYAANGKKVLLPQSDQAAPAIADALRKAGASVTAVVAYRTCVPESLGSGVVNRIRRDGADVFVFASPSAFRNFAQLLGESGVKQFAQQSVFAVIGPTTAQAVRGAGFPVAIEAARPGARGLVDAIVEYFSSIDAARTTR